ncbi:MAG: NYN domain-containing protein [Candidatus Berkelbacteria bacterium]|nr:NYN domain-containing protein [Candidatus Berkelbacteria bacterium]
MKNESKNYAFIDGQNLNLGIKELGWKLDLKKFRKYLEDKYQVKKAYYFIGYIDGNQVLYQMLQEYGYILIFKPTLSDSDGKIKGNCDAELVLHTMIEFKNFDKAIIVTSDGDFACLVDYLIGKEKLKTVLAPSNRKYSSLLRKITKGKFVAFLDVLKPKLVFRSQKKEKDPLGTKPVWSLFVVILLQL